MTLMNHDLIIFTEWTPNLIFIFMQISVSYRYKNIHEPQVKGLEVQLIFFSSTSLTPSLSLLIICIKHNIVLKIYFAGVHKIQVQPSQSYSPSISLKKTKYIRVFPQARKVT